MPRGRPLRPLSLSPNERDILQSMTRSRSLPHALVVRAQIVLLAAQRQSNTAIAKQLRLARPTVGLWRQRYLEQRIPGLYDELRPGGPRSIDRAPPRRSLTSRRPRTASTSKPGSPIRIRAA